jgi:hypothetical protein
MAAIWNNHSQAEYNRMAGAPAYLPAEFQCHWERIRQARLLRSGQHRQYFLNEQRSQFDFPPLEANGRRITPFIHYGLLGLIANKSGDLLFGQEPTLSATDNARQQGPLSPCPIAATSRRSCTHPRRRHRARPARSWKRSSGMARSTSRRSMDRRSSRSAGSCRITSIAAISASR